MSIPDTTPPLLPPEPPRQAGKPENLNHTDPGPSCRQRCSFSFPGVPSSTKGPVGALYLRWAPAQHLILKSLFCPGLHCPPVPVHLSSPCPKTPLCSLPELRTAQPQNKPTSDHPGNSEVTCWCTGTGGVAEQPLGERSHIPHSALEAPQDRSALPRAGGSTIHRTPPTPCPKSKATETPRPRYLGPGAAGGQRGSIHTAAAPEGAASSMPAVTEPD